MVAKPKKMRMKMLHYWRLHGDPMLGTPKRKNAAYCSFSGRENNGEFRIGMEGAEWLRLEKEL